MRTPLVAAVLLATSCASAEGAASPTSTTPPPTPSSVTSAPAAVTATTTATTTSTSTSTTGPTSTTTVPPTTTSSASTTTSTTTTSTTTTTTTVPEVIAPGDALFLPTDVEVEIGRSVQGRPITVIRRGTPGGTRVLAVGVIHGNEADGVAIIDRLAVEPVPEGIELWLVRSMNPDGEAISDRQNANGVDLNRNFPQNWDVLGVPGDWQYGGVGPASEPETQTMVAFGEAVRPDLILWYHQDLFRIAPGSGRSGEIRRRYAELSGLPIVDITGGTYTGTASQWSRTVLPDGGVGITVELGETLPEDQIVAHVAAVHLVAQEFWP